MSLLQDVLRSKTESNFDELENGFKDIRLNRNRTSLEEKDDSDDELINVISLPGTPSRTRPSSPVKMGASSRLASRAPLTISSNRTDPLKAFPTDVSQRIFSTISPRDLARCALVCKKWARSQTLNYVWFQHYRKENFHDESLPPGKWTKRESKQNWRQVYLKSAREKDRSPVSTPPFSRSGYNTPSRRDSGYQTPKEIKEEQWKADLDNAARPNKVEMREKYKELGGRKARGKTKLGSPGGVRDKGGWNDGGDEWYG